MLSLFPLASNVSHTVGGNRSCDNYSENYLAVCTEVIFLYRSWGSHGKYTGVVCHSLLQWITICLNSPLWTVCLGWPCTAWLIASLSYTSPFTVTRLWSMWSFWLAFCDCGFCSGGCGSVVLTLSICPLMDEDKRLMQASWWEGLAVENTGSYSGWQSHAQ